MRELTIREMQKCQLHILDFIAQYCEEHNLQYFVGGGALLGAYREGRLIPWDDDIDIVMMRSDYERFIRDFEDTDSLRLLDSSRVDGYYYPFAKLCDTNTKMEENVKEKGMRPMNDLGVGVDIFPYDFVPNGFLAMRWRTLQQRALQGLCYRDCRYADPASQISMPKQVMLSWYKLIKGPKGSSIQDYIQSMRKLWADEKKSAQVMDTWTYQLFSYDALFPLGEIELEGKRYAAPGNAKRFLTECYGADFMTPRNTQPDGHGVAYAI